MTAAPRADPCPSIHIASQAAQLLVQGQVFLVEGMRGALE
jgi:hypothetical protein